MKVAYYLVASVFILITLALTIFLVLQFLYSNDEKPELLLVTVVFRNGDRMPHTDAGEGYKNNPNVENNYFPMGQSGLTNEGKLKEYKLGQFLRKKYDDFLNSIYHNEVIEARSTNYDRTKVSLQLVLAGLYPPDSMQIWDSSINWQPIPFHFEPETEDILLTSMQCPRYLQQREKIVKTAKVKEKFKKFENLMRNLTVFTGKHINTFSDIHKVYFTLKMEQKMNLTVPNWAQDVLTNPQVMEAIMVDYELMTYNNLMKKISSGPVIRKMSNEMIDIQNGAIRKGRKIYLYSGHHSNIVTLLSVFGINKFHIPEFSSAIMIEFYRLNKGYYVQIVYYLGSFPEIEILEIPGCLKLCPLDKFLELMKPVTLKEDEDICF